MIQDLVRQPRSLIALEAATSPPVFEVQVKDLTDPNGFGLPPVGVAALAASDPRHSAAIITRLLAGEPGPCRDAVLAGTAAALMLAGKAESLTQGVSIAAKRIDDGAARETLETLRRDS